MWRRNGYQTSSHVEPKHNELFGSTYLQPLLPDHILLEILGTVGRYYEFQQDWWVFSWTFWRLVFWCFFFSGHSNALHLFQMRKSCGNVTKLYCSIHPVQTQGVTLKGQHYYLLFFFLHLRLNSYFPALFLLTGFQVPWRRNKSNCLDNTKRSKLFWPCLCLCNPCMCDAGKWSTGTKNVKH